MSEQEDKRLSQPKRPTTNKRDDWHNYWKELGYTWRTEPEIDAQRQAELTDLRLILRDIDGSYEGSFYVFDENINLGRADVEWLLAAYIQEQKSANGSSDLQQQYTGLDLRGVDLRGADLRGLPMKRINLSKARLEGADLSDACLEEANLSEAVLRHAKLYRAHLEKANFDGICLEQAQLNGAHLEGISVGLNKANMKSTLLINAHLEGAVLLWAEMERSYLAEAHLEGASLIGVNLKLATLSKAHLEGADLSDARLEGANLTKAHLHGTNLSGVHLESAILSEAHLEGTIMPPDIQQSVRQWEQNFPEVLPPANLNGAFFDTTTNLKGLILGDSKLGAVSLADVHWGDANLAVVDWASLKMLGDERKAHQTKTSLGGVKERNDCFEVYQTAVRANRQLAVVLRDQGLNEEADRFAYRAQLLQRSVWRLQHRYLKYIGSWLLWLLAGYGYRPLRSILWYLVIVIGFAIAYFVFGHLSLFPPDAFVYSLTSFHGRGFFPGLEHRTSLHDPLIMLAAIEAVIGLFIEISFIATFTQRFFGR